MFKCCFVLFVCLLFYSYTICANNVTLTNISYSAAINLNKPSPIRLFIKQKQKLNKKITAAALAFPFPFGIVGLHRIYLGTKPHVPVVYIATLGGVFGILPLVDFFVIITDKDFEQYKNNGKIFMWIKD